MKIIGLQSNNIKRLKAVTLAIDEKDNLVIVSGKNAQGKTSLLDSIWMALGGTKAIPDKPIRDGEESADITLDIKGEKLSFKVHRSFTEKASYLTVTNEQGAKYSNPQEMLNHLIGNLTFDPLEFTRLANKEQVAQLMQLTGLNFDETDKEIKELREERTMVGREGKTFTALDGEALEQVQKLAATEEVSIAQMSTKYQELSKQKQEHDQGQRRLVEIDEQMKKLVAEKEYILSLEAPKEDPESVKAQIDNADETNKAIREAKSKLESHTKHSEKKSEYEGLTSKIQEKEEGKKKALAESKMPINGLAWDDEGVKYNDIPFNQLSGAEQLKVSMAIAMASNPHMRVILIKDGSLLDKDNLSVIESMAKEKDFQIWMEVVSDSGEVGIYIEDGEIKNNNQ